MNLSEEIALEKELKRSHRNYQICKRRRIEIADKNWLWWWLDSLELRNELKNFAVKK